MKLSSFLIKKIRVLKLKQNTSEWISVRKKFRTASETPIVLNLSPWKTPGELAMEKFGGAKGFEGNAATRHGHRYEEEARSAYEDENARKMTPTVVVRGDYLASLDGWSKCRKIVLEIKCPFSADRGHTWKNAMEQAVEPHYYYQIQHQLMVSGASQCDLWVYNTEDQEGIKVSVTRNPGAFTRILNAWEDFFLRYG